MERSSERSRASLQMLVVGARTTSYAPPDCSVFLLTNYEASLLIRKHRRNCQWLRMLGFGSVQKLSPLPRILNSARPYSTLERKSRLFHYLAEKTCMFFPS